MCTASGQAQRHGGKGIAIGHRQVVLDAAYQAHPERFVRSAPKSLGVRANPQITRQDIESQVNQNSMLFEQIFVVDRSRFAAPTRSSPAARN
jgi:hypothetical protein